MKSLLKTFTVTGALALLAVFPVEAQTRIRIGGTGTPEGPDTKVIELFKANMEKQLGGSVVVDIYPSSQLGTWSEMVEQVKGGVLECMYESVGVLGAFSPISNIEGVAYLYRDEDHFFRVWRGPVGKSVIASIAKDSGFQVVGPGFRGFRQFLVKRPADSLTDLQGMKVRAPGIPAYITSIAALGVNPTSIAFEETYAALQQGVVDGLEQPLVAIKDHRFFEVAKHLVVSNHMAETMAFICNAPWYGKLDAPTKTAFEKAAEASADWYRAYTDESSQQILDELQKDGVIVHTPNLDEFAKRAAEAKHDAALQPIINQFRSVN